MIKLNLTENIFSLTFFTLVLATFALFAINYPLHAATAAPTTIRVG